MRSLSARHGEESRLSASVRTQAHVARRLLEQFLALSDVQGEEAADTARRALANLQDLADNYGPVDEQPPIVVADPDDRVLLADVLRSAIDDPREDDASKPVARLRVLLALLQEAA